MEPHRLRLIVWRKLTLSLDAILYGSMEISSQKKLASQRLNNELSDLV